MMNANLYNNIFQFFKNSFLTEKETNAIFYFFNEVLGSLCFFNNYIIDFRNPSIKYKIEKTKENECPSITILPDCYVTNNFFTIVIYKSSEFSPTFSYKEVFNGIVREDLIWLGNKFPKKIESRFYDAAAWNYMLFEIEKNKFPTSLQHICKKITSNNLVIENYSDITAYPPINLILDGYKPELLPDVEVITEEATSLLTLKVHQKEITHVLCGDWYYYHLNYVQQNEDIKNLKTSNDYPRSLKQF